MLYDVLWSILGVESNGLISGIIVAYTLTITLRCPFSFLFVPVSQLHTNSFTSLVHNTLNCPVVLNTIPKLFVALKEKSA